MNNEVYLIQISLIYIAFTKYILKNMKQLRNIIKLDCLLKYWKKIWANPCWDTTLSSKTLSSNALSSKEHWSNGTLVEWNIGRTEHWSNGTLVYCCGCQVMGLLLFYFQRKRDQQYPRNPSKTTRLFLEREFNAFWIVL